MNHDRLDMILSDAYSEPVCPSEELVKRIKSSLKKPGLIERVLASSIALNLIGTFLFLCLVFAGIHNTAAKILLFAAAQAVQNAVILLIWLYREEIRKVFINMETNMS